MRVVGPDGRPLPAYSVRAVRAGTFAGYLDGRADVFRRSPQEPWDTSYVIVPAAGEPATFAPTTWRATVPDGAAPVVTLPVGRVLRGRLVDPRGEGIAGVEVHARATTAREMAASR